MSDTNPIRDAIAEAIRDNKTILFMKGTPDAPACGFSARTVGALQALDAPFAAVDILPDPRIRQELSALSNWPTIPQLFVEGELVGGCDIVTEMFETGELAETLGVEQPDGRRRARRTPRRRAAGHREPPLLDGGLRPHHDPQLRASADAQLRVAQDLDLRRRRVAAVVAGVAEARGHPVLARQRRERLRPAGRGRAGPDRRRSCRPRRPADGERRGEVLGVALPRDRVGAASRSASGCARPCSS